MVLYEKHSVSAPDACAYVDYILQTNNYFALDVGMLYEL
jgi:hypothetical protein